MLAIITGATFRSSDGKVFANIQGFKGKPTAREGESGFTTFQYRTSPEIGKAMLLAMKEPQVCDIEQQTASRT